MLNYRRVRSIYNPNNHSVHAQYAAWTHWLAQRVFSAHPELSALRVSQEYLHTGEGNADAQVLDTQYLQEHTRTERP
jgi:hypothetical protein